MTGTPEANADAIAHACLALAKSLGAEQAVVMIGLPDGDHSAFAARSNGACLPVRGLLEIGAETIRSKLIFTDGG